MFDACRDSEENKFDMSFWPPLSLLATNKKTGTNACIYRPD